MGLSGVTVLLASGDNGVGCDATGSSQEFDFPDCPHITMVLVLLLLFDHRTFFPWRYLDLCWIK
jgi:hypothetical protein